MKNQKSRKILSMLLTVSMVFTMATMSTFATDGGEITPEPSSSPETTPMLLGSPAEQFTGVTPGTTYYFDLSGEAGTITNGKSDKIGTINNSNTGGEPLSRLA